MYYSACSIIRTKDVEIGHFNSDGVFVMDRIETRVEPCGTPLFTNLETTTGVCRSCREGWEVEDNVFASPEERTRATTKQVADCTNCGGKLTEQDHYCPACGLWNPNNRR